VYSMDSISSLDSTCVHKQCTADKHFYLSYISLKHITAGLRGLIPSLTTPTSHPIDVERAKLVCGAEYWFSSRMGVETWNGLFYAFGNC